MYCDSKIVFACSSQEAADKCFSRFNSIINQKSNILSPEIKEKSKTKIKFKNGSIIEIIIPTKREEVIRGKRASKNHWIFDWECNGIDDATIEEALKPFISDNITIKTGNELLYCSSSDES